jgi:8-oxo-dGTP pyrophosphatase MutT (NUDIX family)
MTYFETQILLEKYNSIYSEELDYKQNMLQLIELAPRCYSRDLLEGHFTASAFIVNNDCTKTLLVKHRKLNKWLQPGGHCDGEQNLLKVAIKEANEETGLSNFDTDSEIFDIDIHSIPERKGVPEHLHYDVRFLLISNENDELKISDESVDLQWIPLGQIVNYNPDASIMRMVNKVSPKF